MKRFFKFLVIVLAFVLAVPMCLTSNKTASALAEKQIVSSSDFANTTSAIINDFSNFKNRIAGSTGESAAAGYIKDYLNANTNLKPLNNNFVEDGVQTFNYDSHLSGVYQKSQNIIFTLNAKTVTTKKVIIGCHYDSVAFDMDINSETYGDFVDSESINGSAGSVALLLAVAKYIEPADNFNIEFVFFGAGEDQKAGSKYYTQGISEEDKNDIICMINVSQVAYGNNLYFYMNEIDTKTSSYVDSLIYDNKIKINKVDVTNLNRNFVEQDMPLGLNYTHVALDSDNVNFMSEGIETVNIFAGDYSEGLTIGRQEFAQKDLITYTANDNREYINNANPEFSIEENLYQVFKGISCLLSDANFVSTFEAGKGATSTFYKIFANPKLVLYISVLVFVVFVVVAMFIYYKLSIKAYHANIEMEFLSSVVKISDQIDKTGKDENVAKVVSQVIANDIKKDKVIKVKPTKKDKNNDK